MSTMVDVLCRVSNLNGSYFIKFYTFCIRFQSIFNLNILIKTFCFRKKDAPAEFAVYINYTRALRFEDRPDYAHLRRLLKDRFANERFQNDGIFDWTLAMQTDDRCRDTNQERREAEREGKTSQSAKKGSTEDDSKKRDKDAGRKSHESGKKDRKSGNAGTDGHKSSGTNLYIFLFRLEF